MSEYQTWFRVGRYEYVPEPCNTVVKVTEKTISYERDNRRIDRENKASEWCRWFPTREGAVAYIVERCEAKVRQARRTIDECEAAIAALKS